MESRCPQRIVRQLRCSFATVVYFRLKIAGSLDTSIVCSFARTSHAVPFQGRLGLVAQRFFSVLPLFFADGVFFQD